MLAPKVKSRRPFPALVGERVGLLLVSGDSVLVSLRKDIVALAARHAVTALYHRREFTVAGGLMSFGPSLSEAFTKLATISVAS